MNSERFTRSLALFSFGAALFIFTGCAHPPGRVASHSFPGRDSFRFSSGNFWSGGYTVESDGKTVRLELDYHRLGKSRSIPRRLVSHPSPKHWETFWAELTVLQVFHWRSIYCSKDLGGLPVADATEWSLQAVHEGRGIRSEGSDGMGPANADAHKTSQDGIRIWMLENAIHRLTGNFPPP